MGVTTNPFNNKTYEIPSKEEELKDLKDFIAEQNNEKIVVVQGLGFVGAVMALVVANSKENYTVIGVDLPSEAHYWKIASLNEGIFPIESSDSKITTYYENAKKKNNFFATSLEEAYQYANIVIVDINLDVQKQQNSNKELLDYDVSLEGFKHAMRSIANWCQEDVLVLVESTVPPGTCKLVVEPIFKEIFHKRALDLEYSIGHSYERVMPGPGYIDSITNFFRVYSGIDEKSADATEKFLKTIISTEEYPLTRLANTTASEMGKVLENSYRAMNIAFVEEWGKFAESADVNIYEVIDAIKLRPTHNNLMRPGLGVGGYCLTKDPLLASWSSKNLFGGDLLRVSERAVQINDQMPLHAFQLIRSNLGDLNNKRALMLGVSYLNDVGDTRYTPSELLYDKLIAEGVTIDLHDFFIPFWEEKGITVSTSLSDLLVNNYDFIILCVGHKAYKENVELLKFLMSKEHVIFDVNGVLNKNMIEQLRNKKLRILGRGDLL